MSMLAKLLGVLRKMTAQISEEVVDIILVFKKRKNKDIETSQYILKIYEKSNFYVYKHLRYYQERKN